MVTPARIDRSFAAFNAGDFAAAAADFSRALREDPENASLYEFRAQARQALGQLAGAESDLEKAVALAPGRSDLALKAAGIFFAHRRFERALAHCGAAVRLGAGARAVSLRDEILSVAEAGGGLKVNDFASCARELRRRYLDARPGDLDPATVPALRKRAGLAVYRRALVSGGEGLAGLEELAHDAPDSESWLSCLLGRGLLSAGRFADAAAALRRGAARRPRDWRARAWLAEAQAALGKPPRAEIRAEGALAEQARLYQGKLLLWEGRYAAARRCFDDEKTAALDRCGWGAGAVLLSGNPGEALRRLDANRAALTDPEARVWRGEALRLLGRNEEALAALADDGTPASVWRLINRALVWAALGRREKLLEDFWSLPPALREAIKRRGRAPADRPLTSAQIVRCLERARTAARGFRRDDHAQAVWLSR